MLGRLLCALGRHRWSQPWVIAIRRDYPLPEKLWEERECARCGLKEEKRAGVLRARWRRIR